MRSKKKESRQEKKQEKKQKKRKNKDSLRETLELKLPELNYDNLQAAGIKLGIAKSADEIERIIELNKRIAEENGENISIVVNTPGITEESLEILKREEEKRNNTVADFEPELEEENISNNTTNNIKELNSLFKDKRKNEDERQISEIEEQNENIENDLKGTEEENNIFPENDNEDEVNNEAGKDIDDDKTELLLKPKPKISSYYLTLKNGYKINITSSVFRMGRNKQYNDYYFTNKKISSKHAEILTKNGKTYIKDLNSTNGTLLDGYKIPPNTEVEIKVGAKIVLANEEMILGKGK